jgi:hypothetical protein
MLQTLNLICNFSLLNRQCHQLEIDFKLLIENFGIFSSRRVQQAGKKVLVYQCENAFMIQLESLLLHLKCTLIGQRQVLL